MINAEGRACGLVQGELLSMERMLFGMRTLTEIVWSHIWEFGLRNGWPGSFYLVAAALKMIGFCSATCSCVYKGRSVIDTTNAHKAA
jgi:hypothetical protein